jgi:polyphosphate glucokinase
MIQGNNMEYFGIDIGCTAIKYGCVTLQREIKINDFDMLLMPQTCRTEKYTDALTHLLQNASIYKAIGIGFPSVVWDDGIMDLEIKFNDIWIQISELVRTVNVPCFAINDADAAGYAEVCHPSASALRKGVTVVLTLGTGIGSGVFLDGKLFPNTEFGMIEMHGMLAEHYTAASIKRRDSLSIQEWTSRLQEYLTKIEILLSPDHIIIGGGISADFESYRHLLKTNRAALLPAYYRNQAGVIGAAMNAAIHTGITLVN